MTGDKLKEFMRRLIIEDLQHDINEKGEGIIYRDGKEMLFVDKWEMFFDIECDKKFLEHIESLYSEVNEYMTAYEKADSPTESEEDKTNVEDIADSRVIVTYGDHYLCASRWKDGSMDFDVRSYHGGLTVSHSHASYTAAKHEFSYRAGLIDRDLLFPRVQLSALRSVFHEWQTLHNNTEQARQTEKKLEGAISRINHIVDVVKYELLPEPEASRNTLQDKQSEFMRRLSVGGYKHDFDANGAGTIHYRGRKVATINDEGEILYKPENRGIAQRIYNIRAEVDEYMTAYLAATNGQTASGSSTASPNLRTLLKYNNAELAMNKLQSHVEFVTWRTSDRGRDIGHYFDDYRDAKKDFATRSGLLDASRLFTETELLIIRQGLIKCSQLSPDTNMEDVTAVRTLIEKLDELVIPQINRDEVIREANGEEPEWELTSDE